MRNIVYYVASTLDGFISKPGDDISGFVGEGNGVSKYLADLANFDTVVMGKNTYEFGYKYGLKPGEAPYKNMRHYIFSETLKFAKSDSNVHVCAHDINIIKDLKKEKGTDIYLCGGGTFAGWLLDNKQIDILRIKLNPLIAGQGTRLFGESVSSYGTQLIDTAKYDNGLQIISYRLVY